MIDKSEVLFGNFNVYEVARSTTAARNRIDNTPPPKVLKNATRLAEYCLQSIRDNYSRGFSPNSWYRSPALERVICARSFEKWALRHGYRLNQERDAAHAWPAYLALKSHPKGSAADIEVPGVSNDEVFAWCKENLEFDQLIREFAKNGDPHSGWVHISYNNHKNRGEAFHI